MAEILISLTIIGIIAAITLPALQANINEKTWATQRKALYSRMSQAISLLPYINGYGLGSTQEETNEKAALDFVTNGLSKVIKMNDICDSTKLSDCGINSKYKKFQASSKVDFPMTLHELNGYLAYSSNPQNHINTKVAAFETKSGESVAVFYNPACVSKDVEFIIDSKHKNPWPHFCADFVYDLNGKKGPNQVGKDVWFMSVLYSDKMETIQVEPEKISPVAGTTTYTYKQAKAYCASIDARIATVEEQMAFMYNVRLRGTGLGFSRDLSDGKIYVINGGVLYNYAASGIYFRCIYRGKK